MGKYLRFCVVWKGRDCAGPGRSVRVALFIHRSFVVRPLQSRIWSRVCKNSFHLESELWASPQPGGQIEALGCCSVCSRPQGPQGPQGVGAEGGSDGGGAAARASVQCPVCGRQFQGTKRNYLLNRHFQIHTGEKPYQCPHCSHRANRKSNLKMHIESRHGAQAAFYALTPEPGATPDAALPPFLPDALGAGGPEDVQKGGPAARAGELGPGPKGPRAVRSPTRAPRTRVT
nr:zinc finger protein 536-like [Penaeus vannamei]